MLTRSKLIIFSIIAVVAIIFAFFVTYLLLFRGEGDEKVGQDDQPKPSSVTLEVWGLFDDSDVFEPVLAAYMQKHPDTSLRYKKFIWDDYEPTLINALASGRGPDIFMIHNTWLAKHKDKVAPAPFGTGQYDFVGSTKRDFIRDLDKVYGLPLFIDNLALFYNKDLFAQEGFFDPPKTWEQFIDYSKALTRFAPTGSLLRSGAALGADSQTINRATDILLLLLLQNAVEPFEEGKKELAWERDQKRFEAARDALRFYTDFSNPSKNVYTWNEEQHYSIDKFWEGSLAMMFNYAYNIETIRRKAPYLSFSTAPLPKKGRKVTIPNYWGFTVAKSSKYQKEAWDFLTFFFQDEFYLPYIKQTGRLASKPELLESQKDDPLLNAFVDQAASMLTPYQPDEKKVQEILDEMIRKVNKGELSYDQALRLAGERLKLLIE